MTAVSAVVGLAIDQVVGEPPVRLHPVVGFGSLMSRLERRIHADRRWNGVVMLASGVLVAVGVGAVARRVLGPAAATAAATALCAAGSMLDGEATAIGALLERGDLPAARQRLTSLVGRRTTDLDESEVSRAVVESVAENSVDAVTASLLWAAVGGAPAVLAHRAVNTLDAMVGHRNARHVRFGWASARFDDLVNHVPARATAVAVALAHPTRAAAVWRIVRRDARQHPSPNGGVIEAAYAAALDIRLGGVNRYGDSVEDRGTLGDGRSPVAADIARAVALRRRSTVVLSLGVLAAQVLVRRARSTA